MNGKIKNVYATNHEDNKEQKKGKWDPLWLKKRREDTAFLSTAPHNSNLLEQYCIPLPHIWRVELPSPPLEHLYSLPWENKIV